MGSATLVSGILFCLGYQECDKSVALLEALWIGFELVPTQGNEKNCLSFLRVLDQAT